MDEMVMRELPAPGAPIVLGLKLIATPDGAPEAERLMELLKPPLTVVVMVEIPKPTCVMVNDEGEAEIAKSADADSGNVNRKMALSRQRDKTTL